MPGGACDGLGERERFVRLPLGEGDGDGCEDTEGERERPLLRESTDKFPLGGPCAGEGAVITSAGGDIPRWRLLGVPGALCGVPGTLSGEPGVDGDPPGRRRDVLGVRCIFRSITMRLLSSVNSRGGSSGRVCLCGEAVGKGTLGGGVLGGGVVGGPRGREKFMRSLEVAERTRPLKDGREVSIGASETTTLGTLSIVCCGAAASGVFGIGIGIGGGGGASASGVKCDWR
jgi:hypothetical protein